jgi:nucleotide-binding universal stress UspA family protein
MLKMLVPVDSSIQSSEAVEDLLSWTAICKEVQVEIHLLNVQPDLHGDIGMFLSAEQLRAYHHDEGIKALAQTRERLDSVGLPYAFHISVGEIAETVVACAVEYGCHQIVLNGRGVGSLSDLLTGSVSRKIIELSTVPILLLK